MIFRLAPFITIGILIGPIVMGLAYIIGPAFGYAPFFSQYEISLTPFATAFAEPGFTTSIWLSFWIGPAAALISLAVVVLFTASFLGTKWFDLALAAMKPVIAMPHAAAAFGLVFLIAPSGFLLRALSPEITGFTRPPDWLLVNDPQGISLLFGLAVKEIPFLFLVLVAALPQVDARRIKVARMLGYGQIWGWLISTFPAVYAQIRLPVFAVVAFSTSVVDIALIMGPGTPPPLSVRILRWMGDPDLTQRLTAAAAAIIQLAVTMAALVTWWVGERIVGFFGKRLAQKAPRLPDDKSLRVLSAIVVFALTLAVLTGILLLAVSSLSGVWRFPDAFPQTLTFNTWMREADNIITVATRATLIAGAASIIAVALVLACLENEYRNQVVSARWARVVLYMPLLVPQIAFLFGLSIWLLWNGLDGHFSSVVFAHLVFVLPYTYLLLIDPWNAFDQRYLAIGRLLGKSPNRVLFTIRFPMLLRPILTAFALGFAISIAQYLPTLLIGAGRQPTITTEAVALASGGNRRLIGSYALVQTLLPFIVFAITALIPTILWRNRRALQPGSS